MTTPPDPQPAPATLSPVELLRVYRRMLDAHLFEEKAYKLILEELV